MAESWIRTEAIKRIHNWIRSEKACQSSNKYCDWIMNTNETIEENIIVGDEVKNLVTLQINIVAESGKQEK